MPHGGGLCAATTVHDVAACIRPAAVGRLALIHVSSDIMLTTLAGRFPGGQDRRIMEACITHSQACIRRRTCISRACLRKPLARSALQCVSSADFESENPQNVPAPLRVPSPEFSAVDAVRVQLEAAKDNNTPRPDHGVHVLYEFCADAGSMERSRYFGFSKARRQTTNNEQTLLSHSCAVVTDWHGFVFVFVIGLVSFGPLS